MQNTLAKEITTMIHGEDQYLAAKEASSILFKKGDDAVVALKSLSKEVFLEIFEGVPQAEINKDTVSKGMPIINALVESSSFKI